MRKIILTGTVSVLLLTAVNAFGDLVIDFESPTYTAGATVVGQDGWTGDTMVTIGATSGYGDSQGLDFSGANGSFDSVTRSLDRVYDSGLLRVSYYIWDIGGNRSGYSQLIGDGGSVLWGLDKYYWKIEGGAGGTLTSAGNPSGSEHFLEVVAEVDLENGLLDLMYRIAGSTDEYIAIYSDYALSTTQTNFTSISLKNYKISSRFDNVNVTPEPTTLTLLCLGGGLFWKRRR